jgi:GrpB-like predicted nucleotidyltransferase (UPF0157 family)
MFWREQLAFRDALRKSAELGHEYAALKQEPAGRYAWDLDAYTEGRTEFIQEALFGLPSKTLPTGN